MREFGEPLFSTRKIYEDAGYRLDFEAVAIAYFVEKLRTGSQIVVLPEDVKVWWLTDSRFEWVSLVVHYIELS